MPPEAQLPGVEEGLEAARLVARWGKHHLLWAWHAACGAAIDSENLLDRGQGNAPIVRGRQFGESQRFGGFLGGHWRLRV